MYIEQEWKNRIISTKKTDWFSWTPLAQTKKNIWSILWRERKKMLSLHNDELWICLWFTKFIPIVVTTDMHIMTMLISPHWINAKHPITVLENTMISMQQTQIKHSAAIQKNIIAYYIRSWDIKTSWEINNACKEEIHLSYKRSKKRRKGEKTDIIEIKRFPELPSI